MSDAKHPLIYPSVDGMIADALDIVQLEISKYRTKVTQGRSLDPREVKALQGYIRCMVDLSKEDRERTKDDDLSKLSTEELLQLLGQQQRKLPKGTE